MARDTTPKYVPHLASFFTKEHPGVELWYVRMKTASGEYVILTENYASKRNAARKMRQIREDMGRDYVKKIDAGLA
ncbi:TPA: hypothetical protein OUI21_006033 [Pseudomonas aeruginosa]|nr:hypothetical protein [Pseudomonas aeruginosa]